MTWQCHWRQWVICRFEYLSEFRIKCENALRWRWLKDGDIWWKKTKIKNCVPLREPQLWSELHCKTRHRYFFCSRNYRKVSLASKYSWQVLRQNPEWEVWFWKRVPLNAKVQNSDFHVNPSWSTCQDTGERIFWALQIYVLMRVF